MLQILAKIESGSKLYELNTKNSDEDYYSVGLNTKLEHILGIDKYEHQIIQNEEIDSTCMELRKFFNLCRKANTASYELLAAPQLKFIQLNSQFNDLVLWQRHRFFDSKNLFKCLLGYSNGERRAMTQGFSEKLGEKRKEVISKFGFSNYNAVHLLRLLQTGIVFFTEGIYITSFKDYDLKFHELLFDIKTNPVNHNKEEILLKSEEMENNLKKIFDNRDKTKDLIFDEGYANNVLLQFYYPKLKEIYDITS